jgi:hypothetical protein
MMTKPPSNAIPGLATADGHYAIKTTCDLGVVVTEGPKLPVIAPHIEPTHKKIAASIWMAIVGFFNWAYKQNRSETLVHGYYHRERDEWQVFPPSQTPDGMTVAEDRNDSDYLALISRLTTEGWVLRFTIHHHCDSSAFQSGTDQQDEINQPTGYHFTLGHLNKPMLDLHTRLVVRSTPQQLPDGTWTPPDTTTIEHVNPNALVDQPVNVSAMPWLSDRAFFLYNFADAHFPEEWKTAIPKPTVSDAVAELISKPEYVDVYNAITKLPEKDIVELYSGNGVPKLPLPWPKIPNNRKRQLVDKLINTLRALQNAIRTNLPDVPPPNSSLETYLRYAESSPRRTPVGMFPSITTAPGMPTHHQYESHGNLAYLDDNQFLPPNFVNHLPLSGA